MREGGKRARVRRRLNSSQDSSSLITRFLSWSEKSSEESRASLRFILFLLSLLDYGEKETAASTLSLLETCHSISPRKNCQSKQEEAVGGTRDSRCCKADRGCCLPNLCRISWFNVLCRGVFC